MRMYIKNTTDMVTQLTNKWAFNEIGLPVYHGDISVNEVNCFISMLGFWSLLIAVSVIVLAIGIAFLLHKRYKWYEELANRNLTYAFVAVWLFAFVVYDVGMYTSEPWSLVTNVPMVILHAFEVFFINSDISVVNEPYHKNTWYMFGFSLAHFLGALVSLVFVIKHFGYSVIAAIKRRFALSTKESLYVFWGMNNATYNLAKDINNQFMGRNDYRIVVVRTNREKDSLVAQNKMERLFNFLSLTDKDLDRLRKLNCISMSTYSNLSTIETKSVGEEIPSIDILQKELRLKSLRRLIGKKTSKAVHLFFLSDDEEANIQGVANLRFDCGIQAFAKKGKVTLYCHARYNSVHRVIEDELTAKNVEVRVVDSSRICVDLIKQNPELHPVNYVTVEKDATVSSPFNALVIGFGEVGLDVVRFLYEFGAFVKSGTKKPERSDFNCYVVDPNMDNLAGVFKVNAPSIAVTYDKKAVDVSRMINLYNMDSRSVEFYSRLRGWIKALNYIVVAAGDDEMNVSLAVRLLRLAIREREDNLKRLRILVRVQHDENGHFQKIADHYNRLWAANQASEDKNHLYQNIVSVSEKPDTPITLFGSSESVYTYELVVREALKADAKKYKNKYDLSVNEIRRRSGEKTEEIVDWDEEQDKMMQLTGENKGFAPTFSGVMKLRRMQNQNIANSLHKETKKLLAKEALGQENYERMLANGLVRNEGSKTYSWRNGSNDPIGDVQRVLDVLSQTEHLRWIASHEILGYKDYGDEKFHEEAKLLHGCMKPWDELSTEIQSYDYNVVDVSLDLIETM